MWPATVNDSQNGNIHKLFVVGYVPCPKGCSNRGVCNTTSGTSVLRNLETEYHHVKEYAIACHTTLMKTAANVINFRKNKIFSL